MQQKQVRAQKDSESHPFEIKIRRISVQFRGLCIVICAIPQPRNLLAQVTGSLPVSQLVQFFFVATLKMLGDFLFGGAIE